METINNPGQTLSTCQQMLDTIEAQIAELEQRRTYWEQLGHRAVAAMYETNQEADYE